MKKNQFLILPVFLLIAFATFAQDVHYTNYYFSPLYLSPANTGSFAGTVRINANARTQFNTFIVEPYRTIMASADMNIAAGLKEHHWIGAGLNIFSDSAGDLAFESTGVHISLAYHWAFDSNYKTVLTLGGQAGAVQRGIDPSGFSSGFELSNPGKMDNDLSLIDAFNPTTIDYNIGLSLKRVTSKTNYLDFGVAVYHLTESKYQFSNSAIDNTIARRYNAYAEYYAQATRQLAIVPSVVYSRMFNFNNIFGQFNLHYQPNRKSPTIIKGGLGYRLGDALQFLAGMYYKGWDVGIAYDLTVSTASRFTNGFGGLEIGIRKILIKNTKPDTKPAILCPNF